MKSFVGTSENALRIQIWTAAWIAILLLKWLHICRRPNGPVQSGLHVASEPFYLP